VAVLELRLSLHTQLFRWIRLLTGNAVLCGLFFGVSFASFPSALAQDASANALDQQKLLAFLNQTVTWYQRVAVERQVATTPGDILFTTDNRPVADQVVRLSFEFARTSNQWWGKSPNSTPAPPLSDARYQRLAQAASKLDNQSNKTRAELDALRQRLETAKPRERKALESEIAENQSELALLQARADVLRGMLQFMGGAAEPGDLTFQIEALERSVPSAATADQQSAKSNPESPTLVASGRGLEPSGIWEIFRALFGLSRKLDVINRSIRQTDDLKQTVKAVQAPLIDRMKAMLHESDTIFNQPDTKDPKILVQQKSTLDALTIQFKQLSASVLPLSKESILLDTYGKNLGDWQAAVKGEYAIDIKTLLVRLLALGLLLGLVLGAFELWRRAIYRYVPDVRRRYQFLLLRRIALWFVILLIAAFGFVSELGSLATFAGLMTAGVAVALQNVILAVVGYFLLIGKYGVRVGDRVQVSGVNGEVVEIGLIRLHVMELTGAGGDAQPTGRVVAFSNSIVFQPTAGLFKQAPGTSFLWHEISLTLAADTDYRTAERRMLAAIDAAFKNYQKDLEDIRRQMSNSLTSVTVGSLEPKVRFHLTSAGLEVLIRFPVALKNATEMDDRVTRELLHAIEMEPRLKVVGADVPTIRLRTDSPASGTSPA
jgi:small-conductance mechanosensitive channel